MLGGVALTTAMIIHTQCLKYLDLTLVAANSASCIIAAIVLSTQVLGEKFILRYDLPALIFISAGCAVLVLNANMVQKSYTHDDVIDVLTATRTICFFSVSVICTWLLFGLIRTMLKGLRRFELDVEEY